jgi:hypothetical protein
LTARETANHPRRSGRQQAATLGQRLRRPGIDMDGPARRTGASRSSGAGVST